MDKGREELVDAAGAAAEVDPRSLTRPHDAFAVGNKAIMEGNDNPDEIRRLILERVRRSQSAGLGDERSTPAPPARDWTPELLRLLRQILDQARSLG